MAIINVGDYVEHRDGTLGQVMGLDAQMPPEYPALVVMTSYQMFVTADQSEWTVASGRQHELIKKAIMPPLTTEETSGIFWRTIGTIHTAYVKDKPAGYTIMPESGSTRFIVIDPSEKRTPFNSLREAKDSVRVTYKAPNNKL